MPAKDESTEPTGSKKADAFAELVQCLADRSLCLVIREVRDDGDETGENVMSLQSGEKFEGNCFKCGKKKHRKSES